LPTSVKFLRDMHPGRDRTVWGKKKKERRRKRMKNRLCITWQKKRGRRGEKDRGRGKGSPKKGAGGNSFKYTYWGQTSVCKDGRRPLGGKVKTNPHSQEVPVGERDQRHQNVGQNNGNDPVGQRHYVRKTIGGGKTLEGK